jgi:hypothetical protein
MRTRSRRFAVIPVALLALVGALAWGVSAQADDGDDLNGGGGFTITVTVTASPTPTPTPSPTTSRPPSSSSSSSSGSGSGSTVVVSNPTPVPTPSPTEYSLGGALYVSGLSTQYVPSLNPFEGQVRAQFSVRNVSTTPITSRVQFSLDGPFGQRLDTVGNIELRRLMPQETRVVDAVLTGPGQWTFTTARFTLTPITEVDGTALEPMSRDAIVFFVPWFVLVLALLGVAIYAVVRTVRGSQPAQGAVAGSYP